jgi:hypothetical protein
LPIGGAPLQDASPVAGQAAADGTATGEPVKKTRTSTRTKFRADGEPKIAASKEPLTSFAIETVGADGQPERREWNAKKHLPIGKDDFEDEANYWDWKAEQSKATVRRAEQAAQTCRAGGTAEQRKAVKKMTSVYDQMAAMQKTLTEQLGPEAVQALLAKLAAQSGAVMPLGGLAAGSAPVAAGSPAAGL